MDDFVANRSNWRTLALVGLSVGFVAAGLWMTGLFNDVPTTRRYSVAFTVLAGWFCVALFSFCAMAGLKSLLGSNELLRVGQLGVRWMPWSDQIIPWNEIADVTTWTSKGQKFIVLHLHNPHRFPATTMFPAKALRASQAMNRAVSGGDIAFSLSTSDRTTEQSLAAIRQFRSYGS